MRWIGKTLALAAAAVGAIALASSPSAATPTDGAQEARAGMLKFRVVFSPFNYTDLGQPGPSAADVIVFHDQLFAQSTPVGDEVGSCTLVDATGLSDCTGVVQLTGRGTIAFAFVNSPPPHKVLAVTGGSGQFRSARGDGFLDENGDGTGTLVLHLNP